MIEGLGSEKNVTGPQRIDLLFDRSCNLACRTCNPGASTFWEKHLRDNNLPVVKFQPTDNLATIKEVLKNLDLSNLKQVQFCGGETLLGNTYWQAAEMIAELVLARKLETTGHEIIKAVHPHPTMSEAVMEAAAAAYGEVIHL